MNQRQFNARIRREFDAVLDAGEIFDIADMAKEVARRLRQDREVLAYLIHVQFEQLVRKQLNQVIDARERLGGRTVQPAPPQGTPGPAAIPEAASALERRLIRIGSAAGPVAKMKVMLREQGRAMDFSAWNEFDPVRRIELQLPNMNRQQLLDAAAYRYNRAASEVHNAAFLRELAEPLGPSQLVQDVYDNEALTKIWARINAVEEFSIATSAADPAALEG